MSDHSQLLPLGDRLRREGDPVGTESANTETPFLNITTHARHGEPDYASKTALGCEASGEPVFILRAQDETAAAVIRFWASVQSNEEIAREADRIAERFHAWPVKKSAD